eukprot:5781274-Amphidinium_carterae.1
MIRQLWRSDLEFEDRTPSTGAQWDGRLSGGNGGGSTHMAGASSQEQPESRRLRPEAKYSEEPRKEGASNDRNLSISCSAFLAFLCLSSAAVMLL